jgi:hypothetical protein
MFLKPKSLIYGNIRGKYYGKFGEEFQRSFHKPVPTGKLIKHVYNDGADWDFRRTVDRS